MSARSPRHLCLAISAPGVEELCRHELGALGVRIRRAFRGGVEFSANERQLYAANLWSRTANRIVVRVARFEARTFRDLETAAAEVDWSPFIPPGGAPSFRVSSTSSRLSHTGAVEDSLSSVLGGGPEPGPLIVVRLMHDRVTISVDSSGQPLYQRGWRLEGATAPIRETLAAAAVMASGWDRRAPLVDPFCGSGTIAIEAALLAAGRPPGEGRAFAFQGWPSFAPGTWASLAAPVTGGNPPVVLAADLDAETVAAASRNAERAGVDVTFRQADIADLAPPSGGPGWLVSNPPYGRRVGGDVGELYATLASVIEQRLPGWRGMLLVADPRLVLRSGLRLTERMKTQNGGIPVHLMSFGDVDTVAP